MQLQTINAYEPFVAQIVELKAYDAAQAFDYATPAGNKAARSHVYKLRQTRAAIEKARKDAKADALELGRKIDNEAKRLDAEVCALIDRHDGELAKLEAAETKRIAGIRSRIDELKLLGIVSNETSAGLRDNLAELEAFVVDDTFAEFKAEAEQAKATARAALLLAVPMAEKREADAAELQRLRAESEARSKAEREAKIAADAAERAAKVERDKAEAAIKDAQRREAEALAAVERAEREKVEAASRAEKEKAAAIEAEQKRLAKIEADKKAEAERLERDKQHRAPIKSKVVQALVLLGFSGADADVLFDEIAAGHVPHVKVSW